MESCWRQTISAPDPASLGVWGPESCLLPGPRRQTVWAQLWWSQRRTWRCWFPGRLLAYRERWESRKLWFWGRTKTEGRVKTHRLKAAQKDLTTKEKPNIYKTVALHRKQQRCHPAQKSAGPCRVKRSVIISTADASAAPHGLPLIRGVKLHRQHVQGIPGGDADSSKQAQQRNHGWLAVAKGQEEAADAGDNAGAGWRSRKETEILPFFKFYFIIMLNITFGDFTLKIYKTNQNILD